MQMNSRKKVNIYFSCRAYKNNKTSTWDMNYKITTCGLPTNPTLRPYPNFNANSDVELLKKAMDGMGKAPKDFLKDRNILNRNCCINAYKRE